MRSLLLLSLSLRTNQPTNFAFKREPRKKNEEYLGRNANATWVGLVLLLPNNAETKRFKFNFNPPNSCFDGFALAYILFLFLFLFFLFSSPPPFLQKAFQETYSWWLFCKSWRDEESLGDLWYDEEEWLHSHCTHI